MNQICETEKCTGCHSCFNTCPKKCITMKTDSHGFLYPEIDSEKCVDCGLCQKSCPVVNVEKLHEPISIYAATNKEQADYETATSGGIATLLTRKVLSENGVAYGAALSSDVEVKHIRIEDYEDIEMLKGSKYVQSIIGDSFTAVKNDLLLGRMVLFIGTPCQVAGVKKYLGKEYENLYTCDIVCHGVPSNQYLKNHIESVSDLREVNNVGFRDKEGYYLSLYASGTQIYRCKNFYDIYCLGFLRGLILRTNCSICIYAQSKRVGDVTLGDFWGVDSKKEEFPVSTINGLSLVMVNTEKGKQLLDSCKEGMVYQERELCEAVNGNKQLRHPSAKHKNFTKFKKNYLKIGFEKAAKRALWKERIVYALLDKFWR